MDDADAVDYKLDMTDDELRDILNRDGQYTLKSIAVTYKCDLLLTVIAAPGVPHARRLRTQSLRWP
ncbi:hypothetical protein L917_20765 [Phytophthora nicotianae]|uniref:Uncharacterized protein n=2 Tax=Phytophthora nicotianae TaxID=4792 RepID=W2JZR4_PHYNI|nr:hypothetical protein L917_20765 [Phytophthora nicotianae]ETO60100.1 hypothetical protein F444_21667 [Phytophthora nicotianae P1976]